MSVPKTSSSVDLALLAMRVFGNDGTIDMRELEELLRVALLDGEVDDDERHVLKNIFDKVPRWELAPDVWQRICEVRTKYGI